MDITFLGTGTCVHGTENRAQSSILVEANGITLLVDCGAGTFLRLHDAGVHVNSIDAILLTHNHTDHNSDLLPILKARWLEKGGEIKIYGPQGTGEFVSRLLEAYAYLREKLSFTVDESASFSIRDLKVTAIDTAHSIASRGYLIEQGGKRVVISGDTYPQKNIFNTPCNVLIHELSLPFGSQTTDHTTPENMAQFLESSKAHKLYFIHIYPHTYKIIDEIRDYLSKYTGAQIYIPKDLDKIHVK
ncbi:MAG: MBL fold metallo-hydrolase [Archaeoglobaceae archaeon]